MNSIFRKTLIASTLSVVLSSAAFATDDYKNTIDGSPADENQQNSQTDNSATDSYNSDKNKDYQDTIDGKTETHAKDNMKDHDKSKNHDMNKGDTEEFPKTDHQDNVTEQEEEEEETMPRGRHEGTNGVDMDNSNDTEMNRDESGSGKYDKSQNQRMDKSDAMDRPLTDHQENVIEEEEEEEEVMPRDRGNTSTDTQVGGDRNTGSQVGTDRNSGSQVGSDRNMDPELGTDRNSGSQVGSDQKKDTQIDYSDDTRMNTQTDESPNATSMDQNNMSSHASNLYSMSADELVGMNVQGNDEEELGHVSSIVLSPDQKNVHAVISIGSIMGLGGRDVLVPLHELTLVNEELHIDANKDEIETMTEYGSDNFVELEGDAAISTAVRPR